MLVIKRKQIIKLEEKRVDNFINSIISNLIEKQPEKINDQTNESLYKRIKGLVFWGRSKELESSKDLEDFVNLCFKYWGLVHEFNDPQILEIFNYPDRKPEEKIMHFHYYLDTKYGG